MRVGFLHVGPDTSLAEIAVTSVRKTMPGVPILLMTNAETPSIGEDIRQERAGSGGLMTYRMDHLAALPDGEWLILDTDVIVQRDLRPLLPAGEWDVALTRRTVQFDVDGNNIAETMPYNTGVMVCRSARFWEQCAKVCWKLPSQLHRWYGDQYAVRIVADQGEFDVLELPVDPWNYSPEYMAEDVASKFVVHYKGKRKEWMRGRRNEIAGSRQTTPLANGAGPGIAR